MTDLDNNSGAYPLQTILGHALKTYAKNVGLALKTFR